MATTAITISTSDAKLWLRVTHALDDAQIAGLVTAALKYIECQVGPNSWAAITTAGKLPELLKVAALELVAHWYGPGREAVATGANADKAAEVPLGVERCIRQYQDLVI